MKITFILPCVGRKAHEAYPKTWLMEPLSIAVLSALTPPEYSRVFYDDRIEAIPYDEPTDLVAISVETYTARRAYQICAQYRRRGIPVVMGGFHPTLASGDAARHCNSIVIGEAEILWPEVLRDFSNGCLKPRYQSNERPLLNNLFPDRSVFAGKHYMNLALIETGRGCRLKCEFCSISAFFKRSYSARPVEDVVEEIKRLARKNVFFVDDNLAVDRARSLSLFRAIAPLRIRWAGQVSVHAAHDAELMNAMRKSGCMGVLVGFESLIAGSGAVAGKGLRGAPRKVYEDAMAQFARHRIAVYGTFVFGYEHDTRETIRDAADFALRYGFFFAAFNHLVPFPGTPLYDRLKDNGSLLETEWWLAPGYRFGDLAFKPSQIAPDDLAASCLEARRSFYGWRSVMKRALNLRCNCRSAFMTSVYLATNLMSGKDVDRRQGMPLGAEE